MSELLQRLTRLQDQLVYENQQAPGLFGEIARMEDLLADTYRNRVPYELLQNSDDAGSTTITISQLTDGRWSWANNGRPLNSADIEAMCRSASSTKVRGGDSIGYRGIGFKSIAAISSRIEVRSAGIVFAFDRAKAAELLAADQQAVPLIRIPCDIHGDGWFDGTSFTVVGRGSADESLDAIDPVSLLFLRNVNRVEIVASGRTVPMVVDRNDKRVSLHDLDGSAEFGLLRHGHAIVAIPLDARAQTLTGLRGRLACGLPLNDELGIPVAVSGNLLTDPSRTHAVIADESTQKVLEDAASIIADELSTPTSPLFQRLWELLLEGEDLRSLMVVPHPSASSSLLAALQCAMKRKPKCFSYSPLPLTAEDIQHVFPQGAPLALYEKRNLSSARALKTVLGLETLDLATLAEAPDSEHFSEDLLRNLAEHLSEMTRNYGRALTPAEQRIVNRVATNAEPSGMPDDPAPSTPEMAFTSPQSGEQLAEIVARWRTAELATMEYLNSRNWHLRDVSGQNVGYDLEGTDPTGKSVRIEVKKVDHADARFAMTNNEMALMLADPGGYLFAVLIGDGRYVKLMLLDPGNDHLPKERVCRRWDWEFTDWSRFATVVE